MVRENRERERERERSPTDQADEFGRKRRGRSESPVRLHDLGKRRGRSPSPPVRPGRRRSPSPNHNKRRRHSRSPPPVGRENSGREKGRAVEPEREPAGIRALYDLHYVVSFDAYKAKVGSFFESKVSEHGRDMSPESKKSAVDSELKQAYMRYVHTFRDEDGPNRGEAIRFFAHHKDEEWFWERYDPEGRKVARKNRSQLAKSNRDAMYENEIDWATLDVPGLVMEIEPRPHVTERLGKKGQENKEIKEKEQEVKEGAEAEEDDMEEVGEDDMVTEGEGGMLMFSPKESTKKKDKEGKEETKEEEKEERQEQAKEEEKEEGKEEGDKEMVVAEVSKTKGESSAKEESTVAKRSQDAPAEGPESDTPLDMSSNTNAATTSVVEGKPTATTWCAVALNSKRSLFIRTVPAKVLKVQIEKALKETEGFEHLALSEPMSWKGWTRIAWARYASDDKCEAAIRKLDNKEIPALPPPEPPAKDEEGNVKEDEEPSQEPMLGAKFKLSCTGTKAIVDGKLIPKTAPMTASTPRRMAEDLKLLIELVSALDKEKGIDSNRLLQEIQERGDALELHKKVDLLVHYLRRVHLYLYYKTEEYGELEEMLRKGAALYLRPKLAETFKDEDREWEKQLEEKVRARITAAEKGVDEFSMEDEGANRLLVAFYAANCRELIKGQKYECQLLFKDKKKVFKAPEFVIKHLWNKHTARVRDELYLMAYVTDPHRPAEPPQQMQQQQHGGMHGSYPSHRMMMPHRGGMQGGMFPTRGGGGGPPRGSPMMRLGGGGMRGMPPMGPAGMMMMGGVPPFAGGFPPGLPPPQMLRNMMPMPMPTPPARGRADPRGIKAYVDLDAAGPSYGADIDYRSPSY